MKYIAACEHGEWHLECWPKENPAASARVPFRCRSWRHEGQCRHWKGAQDFVRIQEALAGETKWIYLVLTFAQRDWSSPFEQYRSGCRCWAALYKRFVRRYGVSKYVQTWEKFRKGGVHVNVVLFNHAAILDVESDWKKWRSEWLAPNCRAVGLGLRCWVEVLSGDTSRMAGYLSKLSRELTGSGKGYQIPTDAPPHFRRIRASRHTLPPPYKSDLTGRLHFVPLPAKG